MKSKRILVIVLTAAIMMSAKPVFAKESSNTPLNNTTATAVSTQVVTADKLTASTATDKAKISQEEAKSIAKKTLADYFEFNIDDTKFQTNVNFNSNDYSGEKRSIWSIHWYNQNEEKQINIDIAVDGGTGRVLNVNKYEYDGKQISQPIASFTEEQAKDIGETFLKKINPQEFKETTIFKDKNSIQYYGMGNYGFIYNRVINNIPFEGNRISVGVNGVTGKVTSYEITWDTDLKVPTTDKAIDQKGAEDIFNKNTEMDLNYNTYMSKPNSSQEIKTKLVYTPDPTSPLIVDAVSGKALTGNGEVFESVKSRNITDQQKEDIFKNAEPIPKLESPISSERAEEVIKDKIKELYGEGYELESINYDEQGYGYMGKGIKIWSANYVKKGVENYGTPVGQVAINALTEEVVRIDKFNFNDKPEESFTPKITWEQSYDKAIEFIAKNSPQKIKEINTEQKNLNSQNYMYTGDLAKRYITFNFARTVDGVAFNSNGISYNNDGINVTIDAKTGEVNSFGCMWQDKLDIPPVVKIISNDEAKKVFLDDNKPTLTYLLFNQSKSVNKSDSKIQLVYSVGNRYFPLNSVEASTGKLLNIYGENVDNSIDEFKDKIKGSSVEKEALILASQGIIDTKDFNLEGGVTRLQLIKILVNAKGFNPYMQGMNELSFASGIGAKDSTDYKYVQFGVSYGIVEDSKDEFKGNELVTREELAKSLVKLLGYSKIAEIKGLLNFSYSDSSAVSADKAGYLALAGGLNLLEENSTGKIRPKDTVTMSEVIKAIYTALGSLQK